MKRWPIIVVALVLIVGVGITVGYYVGVRILRAKVVEALGPHSRIAELKVDWYSLKITDLRIDAPKGWPATRTLEAERVTIVPSLLSLLTKEIEIASIVVENPYLSMLRMPGKLIMVPSLAEQAGGKEKTRAQSEGSSDRKVKIAAITLKKGSLELFDATVSRPPLKTRVEDIDAVIRDIAFPAAPKTHFDLAGIVKGRKRDGTVRIVGWVGPGGRDSSSQVVLANVDMVSMQPYLVKKNEARVARGALDLNLFSEVRNNNLDGKGRVIIKELQLVSSPGYFDTFMGMPRDAVIAFLKNHNGEIDVDFTLSGNTNNPNFSLNESLSTRIATAMAGALGVSITEMAGGLGTLGQKGVESAGSVMQGLGSALKGLFSGGPER